ncbi:MAG: hypothetical protein IMY67_08840 [Bacteroidetes bacterium]|nr:hypothetical protein [Bacteroidota bacterium]
MKNLKTTIKKFMSITLTGLVILLFNSCEDLIEEEIILPDSSSSEQLISWNKILNQLDLESETAFVQNGKSIQDAVDAALPGDIIYIEPGTYQEDLTINRSDVKLIGLSITPNDLVINKGIKDNIEILKLYDQKSIDDFQKKSQNQATTSSISDFSRTELGAGVAHYQFKVQIGEGEFDIVRIHRVVRESLPFRPIPTKGDVFMVHGAFTGFDGTFLTIGMESSNDINAHTSSPFYLASKNIDVWGIDMGWTMVPNDDSLDFSFMEGWGYEKDASHTLKAMRIARLVRGMTGQGFSSINLLGFSSGNTVAYAAANRETQENNMSKRHVKGIISVDNAFKVLDGNSGCGTAMPIETEIAGGKFENDFGGFFSLLANLALGTPDELSPIFGGYGLTNIQAFRFVFYGNDILGFHFFGGNLEGSFYSDEMRNLRAIASYSTYMPNLLWQEIDAVNCTSMDVTFDDYLDLISVPILYIGAGGGSGAEAGYYTSSLTASTDITNHLVSLDADPLKDFGHVNIWVGNNADELVWSNLRNWLENHH